MGKIVSDQVLAHSPVSLVSGFPLPASSLLL